MRKALLALIVFCVAGATVFYFVTMPVTVPASALPDHAPDPANGKYMFTAGGCVDCHAVPVSGAAISRSRMPRRSRGAAA